MNILGKNELLSKVWNECTFDEILDYGLQNNHISSESIINAASEYSDPNKEYSDDELKEIILKNADLDLILDIINEKYTVRDIIEKYDQDDVLNCYDTDDLIDFCEYELTDKYDEERNIGYNEGYEDGWNDALTPTSHKNENINQKWCRLCDEFEVSYHDNIGLYNKLTELIRALNKSIYKNKDDKQWISIALEQ